MKMLEAALDKLVVLLKAGGDDPLSLAEYQEAIKTITSSRGKMMRRLVFDCFLRYFLGTTTPPRMDGRRALTDTHVQPPGIGGSGEPGRPDYP